MLRMKVYTALWVLPIGSPPIRNGFVAAEDGRVAAVGGKEEIDEIVGTEHELHELGDSIVMPGLVNAHTHLELSWMGADPPPGGDYVGWVRGFLERREGMDAERARESALEAIGAMLGRGTVAIGDVANETWIVPLLARSALRGVIFHEVYGTRPGDADALVRDARERIDALTEGPDRVIEDDRWRVFLTAHAPHTASTALLRSVASVSDGKDGRFSIHVAESEAEAIFLKQGGGPIAELFRERGMADESYQPSGLSPVEHLDRLGALSEHTLAVHCVHLDHQDHSKLQARGATVVTCPRSNHRLGVGVAPVPQLLGEGIPVALGTDSLASAPDLDLLAEMAALCREHSGLAPAAVVRMATLNGAAALGLANRFGSIEPGKSARLLVVPLDSGDDDPFAAICSEPAEVRWLEDDPPATPRE